MAKNSKIKVTVTMPAYNASKYIKEAIESVLSQDYDRFELLILDDGSTDNTFNIIEKYKGHPKVRIYRNKKNLGGGAARNITIRLARGQYISFCDHDDIMLPGNLKTLSGFLDAHPDIGVVYTKVLVLEMDNKNRFLRTPYVAGKDINAGWDLIKNLIPTGGSMVRKSLLMKAGGFNEVHYYAPVDWDLWLRLAEITKIKHLKDGVYYIVIRRPKALTNMDKKIFHNYELQTIGKTIKRRYKFEFKT